MASTIGGSAVDAQILIWGIKKQATPNRMEMIPRARAFFLDCRLRKVKLILPAQSLAEFLVGYDEAQIAATLAKVGRSFMLAPLDAKAAVIAAAIQSNKRLIDDVRDEFQVGKQYIKADINVLASAIAFGATSLYSEDGPIRRLAENRILVRSLPIVKAQGELFTPPEGGDIQS